MAKWHEPFTWNTICEVALGCSYEKKDEIYEKIMAQDSWRIEDIERMMNE